MNIKNTKWADKLKIHVISPITLYHITNMKQHEKDLKINILLK